MGVLLQAFYKMRPNQAVPSPADGDSTISWWWDHIATQAAELRGAGFSALWLPPVLKSSAGAKLGADGYGPFDDYDIGSKSQMRSVPTRFGSREQLQRCVATLRACGLDVYVDMVEHHRDGDPKNFVFRYAGANSAPAVGRFPKNPSNFVPQVPRDPHLGGPPANDFAFGRELAPINGLPPHYVFDNLVAAGDWLTRALDVQGYRIDDVKGLSTDFLRPFLNSQSMAGKFAVGEFFDGNRILVNGWVFNPGGMQGRSSAFDFPLRFALAAMCNAPGAFDMSQLDHAGLAGVSPLSAVTFLENHDTDIGAGAVITNKLLGYAYILTSEGYPCVYYRDYSTDQNCYGLKLQIDNLIWIHEMLAAGTTQQRWKDFDVFAYEREGGPRLLVGLNNNPNTDRSITVATGFGAGVVLHDYTGHRADVRTIEDGSVQIVVPRNVNGLGYVCYSRTGLAGGFDAAPRAVTQDFEGAPDLDIGPGRNGATVTVGRVWPRAGAPIRANLRPDVQAWTADTKMTLEILAPDLSLLASSETTRNTSTVLDTTATAEGFHTLRLTTEGAPPTNLNPSFLLSVTYTGAQRVQPLVDAGQPHLTGHWATPFALANVAIHAHLLPTQEVLYWGRRNQPSPGNTFASLNEWETHSFLLNLVTQQSRPTANQPTDGQGQKINLFCSSHTFLSDGRLMVVGGHLFDSQGHNAATIYDSAKNTWTAAAPMSRGRWYPTAITLADGSVMVCSGSFALGTPAPAPSPPKTHTNDTPEIWSGTAWKALTDFNDQTDDSSFLYPRFHLAPDGRVFMSGAGADSFFFDSAGTGNWTRTASRHAAAREYAPSVMYDVGRIVYIGGGNAPTAPMAPTNIVEKIDLNQNPLQWLTAAPMHFPRRQHNATLLPDGTVLVTGGTQGGAGLGGQGFNDLSPGEPVHTAELWDPVSDTWSLMAAEQTDRCYHSTALLLPDGRVLSAGGGEYQPDGRLLANDPNDTHLSAQIFSPPYLFRGSRPEIVEAPDSVLYGQSFKISTAGAAAAKATLVRLSSVTHSFNPNQRINFLDLTVGERTVTLTAPPNANACPPGHYLLFLLSRDGVPSIAKTVRIIGAPAALPRIAVEVVDPVSRDREIREAATRPEVVIGLSATCPYGLAACWGGASAALRLLSGVKTVLPLADAKASVAFVYLNHNGLPDIGKWPEEFARSANGSYVWRGVEATASGIIRDDADVLWLPAIAERPRVMLVPLVPADKIQLDQENGVPQPLPISEAEAYARLVTAVNAAPSNLVWFVTGPLNQTPDGLALEVRLFRNSPN